MIEINQLDHLPDRDLLRLASGYSSSQKFSALRSESDSSFSISLELAPLPVPFVKRYDAMSENDLERYRELTRAGFCFGAFNGAHLEGIALAEPQHWNKSLLLWELHVSEPARGKGIGQALIGALSAKALEAGLRTIVCETQNTNVPAIRFYRRMGFRIDGIDLSLYSNNDYPDGEIAIFMKKNLEKIG